MPQSTAGGLRTSLKRLTLPKIQRETAKIILKDRAIIRRKEDELKTSTTPEGGTIGEYRSDGYRLFKLKRNPLARGKVDLFLTGDYVRGIRVKSLGNSKFTLRSTDWKRSKLITGTDGYGLKNEAINQQIWINLQQTNYLPKLINVLRKMT